MRFLSGDQNGLIKSIKINLNDVDINGAGVSTSTISQDDIDPTRSVQKMEYNKETNKVRTIRIECHHSNNISVIYRQSRF